MTRKFICITFRPVCVFPAMAHTINYALEDAPVTEVAGYYFQLGFKHIIPEGLIMFSLSWASA